MTTKWSIPIQLWLHCLFQQTPFKFHGNLFVTLRPYVSTWKTPPPKWCCPFGFTWIPVTLGLVDKRNFHFFQQGSQQSQKQKVKFTELGHSPRGLSEKYYQAPSLNRRTAETKELLCPAPFRVSISGNKQSWAIQHLTWYNKLATLGFTTAIQSRNPPQS